jgi:hypothetical protein
MQSMHLTNRFSRCLLRAALPGLVMLAGPVGGAEAAADLGVAYTPYAFEAAEGWRTQAAGNGGRTRLEGRTWHFDFTQGARSVSLTLPDRSLLSRPERFRLRVRGEAKGHPVYVSLRTHFMTFHKVVGEFTGSGTQELTWAAPPGEGWQWSGGENDGKIHGPLRLGEIRLEANGMTNQGALELIDLTVEGRCPSNRLYVLSADLCSDSHARRNYGYNARFGLPDYENCFRVEVQSLAPRPDRPFKVDFSWVVRNWDGDLMSRPYAGRTEHPAHTNRWHWGFRLPRYPKDLQFAEATFELKIPGQLIAPVHAYWLAPVPPREDSQLQPESPFGMGVYLNRLSLEEMEPIARQARDAGVKWSREDFSWSRIEPRPGEFRWDYYDRLVDCARRNGITVYAIVGYWTSWSKNYTSEGVDQYVAFLRQLVRRYRDRIKQWEIWNEPNIFFWQGPKELYAEMLTKSYAAVKEEDPGAQVLGISTAGIDTAFIDRMLKLGTPFDVLTIHPYRRQFDDVAFINDLKKVSDQVRRPDGTRRPVWLTEMGWATHVPHHVLRQDFEANSERAQAELITRVYLSSIVSGVEPRTFWYNFRNDGEDPFYFEHNMGILRRDGRPKPAYVAYATMTRLLSGLRFQGPVDAGPGNLAYRFGATAGGGREVIAVWNPKTNAVAELRLRAKRVEVVNAVGESERQTPDRTPGAGPERLLRLELKAGVPVFVVP